MHSRSEIITHSTIRRTLAGAALCFVLCASPVRMVVAQQPPEGPAKPPQPAPAQPNFPDKTERIAEIVADVVARTHNIQEWRKKGAVQANLLIRQGETTLVEGVLTYEISRGRSRLEMKDGTVIIDDGTHTHITPADRAVPHADVHATLWSYIMSAPFRLRERGAQPTAYKSFPLQHVIHDTFVLKFQQDDSRRQDDQYVVYVEQRSHVMHAIGEMQIPLFKSGESAREAFAVVYDKYQTIDAVKIATEWSFWKWASDVVGEPIAKATLTDVKFITPTEGTFEPPRAEPPQPKEPGQTPSSSP